MNTFNNFLHVNEFKYWIMKVKLIEWWCLELTSESVLLFALAVVDLFGDELVEEASECVDGQCLRERRVAGRHWFHDLVEVGDQIAVR